MDSNRNSFLGFVVRMEIKDKIQEMVSNTAITEVSSSIICVSVKSAMRNEVITKRQKPSRLAEVFNMCCDVLLAICKTMYGVFRICNHQKKS